MIREFAQRSGRYLSNDALRKTLLIIALVCAAFAGLVSAAPALAQSINIDIGEGGSVTGRLVQLLLLMTVISLAPGALVMITSFTRLVIVFSLLRTALGTQQSPPNTVMISLALFLTFFIMQPTLEQSYNEAVVPLIEEEINEEEAFERFMGPFQEFMLRHVRPKDLELMMDIGQMPAVEDPQATPLRALIPAFIISELRRAFEIGFLLFVPFLVIDMVVASVLMSMGMMMLPPVMIALPFKLIFFVLVDGWYLVVGSLVQSFNPA